MTHGSTHLTQTTTARQLAMIDELRSRPFPARRGPSAAGESGPGFHVAPIWRGRPLDGADPADAVEAGEDCAAGLTALIAVLSLRWGEPAETELTAALERTAMGLPVAAPLDVLCALVPRVHSWRVAGRWVAVGAGAGGTGLPYQVLAAVAEGRGPE
jgi:hypothetical protein